MAAAEESVADRRGGTGAIFSAGTGERTDLESIVRARDCAVGLLKYLGYIFLRAHDKTYPLRRSTEAEPPHETIVPLLLTLGGWKFLWDTDCFG
jgi:hypothetical protein